MTESILEKVRCIPPPGWRHQIDLGHGVVTPGREDCSGELARLQLAANLSGKTVLDVGCSDGYYSFACEQRGAEVTAIDNFLSSPDSGGNNGFRIAAEVLGSRARLLPMSVYDIDTLGSTFDVVLLLNVLYHLRHPALALEKIHQCLCPGGRLYLKTYFHQDIRVGRFGFDWSRTPSARFFETDELNDDASNWWGMNRPCIEGLLRSCGFQTIDRIAQQYDRVYYLAIK